MAKKRKPGRPPKKHAELPKPSANFWRGSGAVLMIVAGIVLAFGAIISAPLPHNLWNGVWWAFGAATFLIPFALVYLGALKFVGEDQQIPLAKLAGTIGLTVFLAGVLHTTFLHTDAATGNLIGGHGGQVGQAIGNVLTHAMGRFLASLVFLILAIFAVFFTFG
ncbi:MAG TPA: DNA translocase FtsK 4TM domain-containing protein, partial [Candidatus Nitrosopolaris sp.]|nr:DNA translocase FtsK 4TM domain-containing protein [Candidatus Nitrosopolaris sp.]